MGSSPDVLGGCTLQPSERPGGSNAGGRFGVSRGQRVFFNSMAPPADKSGVTARSHRSPEEDEVSVSCRHNTNSHDNHGHLRYVQVSLFALIAGVRKAILSIERSPCLYKPVGDIYTDWIEVYGIATMQNVSSTRKARVVR